MIAGYASFICIPALYLVLLFGLKRFDAAQYKILSFSLWVVGSFSCWLAYKGIDWFQGNVSRWTEQAEEKRQAVLLQVKEELPLRLASTLLQHFDPDGNHNYVVEDPRTAATLRTVQQEEQALLQCINQLAYEMHQRVGEHAARDVFSRVGPLVNPFMSRLPAVQALRGNTFGARAMRFVAGAAVGDDDDDGGQGNVPATVAARPRGADRILAAREGEDGAGARGQGRGLGAATAPPAKGGAVGLDRRGGRQADADGQGAGRRGSEGGRGHEVEAGCDESSGTSGGGQSEGLGSRGTPTKGDAWGSGARQPRRALSFGRGADSGGGGKEGVASEGGTPPLGNTDSREGKKGLDDGSDDTEEDPAEHSESKSAGGDSKKDR